MSKLDELKHDVEEQLIERMLAVVKEHLVNFDREDCPAFTLDGLNKKQLAQVYTFVCSFLSVDKSQ